MRQRSMDACGAAGGEGPQRYREPWAGMVRHRLSAERFDRAIEVLLIAPLAFGPMALGVVHTWSEQVVIGLAGILVSLFCLKLFLFPAIPIVRIWTYVPIAAFVLISVFQLWPLPTATVKAISPHTAELKTELLGDLPNAVNLSDGLDGLAAGISAIACGVIAIFAIHNVQVMMAVFMLALVGSLSGFLVYNFNPARIFMGDCGSLFLGFTIAATSVMCVAKSAALVGLALPALALGVPIFDTRFSMLRRFLERRSLFAPDRRHFHCLLLNLGLCQRHAVLTIYAVTLVVTGLGLFMMVSEDIGALVVFVCLLLLLVLLFRCVGAVRLRETLARLRDKHTLARCCKAEKRAFENLQLRFRQAHDARQWWQAVCEAASRMDFAWPSLKKTYPDGRMEVEVWRAAQTKAGMSRLVMMKVPLAGDADGAQREFEIAIWANGSLEAASRRATLFGRLMDESETAIIHGMSDRHYAQDKR